MNHQKQLIISLRQGDEQAFSTIYQQYWKQVYNFTRLYLTNQEEAEEIVQDVFVHLWNSREFLRDDDNFQGLLFIITRNLVFNQKRKSFNHDFYTISVIDALENSYEDLSCNIEDEIDTQDLKNYIDLLISELPPQRQKIFNLSRKEQKSYKEIAQIMNLSERTVEHQISEALRYLRKHMILFTIFIG